MTIARIAQTENNWDRTCSSGIAGFILWTLSVLDRMWFVKKEDSSLQRAQSTLQMIGCKLPSLKPQPRPWTSLDAGFLPWSHSPVPGHRPPSFPPWSHSHIPGRSGKKPRTKELTGDAKKSPLCITIFFSINQNSINCTLKLKILSFTKSSWLQVFANTLIRTNSLFLQKS